MSRAAMIRLPPVARPPGHPPRRAPGPAGSRFGVFPGSVLLPFAAASAAPLFTE